ncbi:MAG TPA: hypothetical protein VI159_11995, partial [Gemmatimonadales bacterium]
MFIAPQAVLYVYLRDRLPNRSRPRQARIVRWSLILLFAFFNFPWIFVARRVLFGSVWSKGWIPYIGPWVAWQMLGWVFLGLVAVYVTFKGIVWCWGKRRGMVGKWDSPRGGESRSSAESPPPPPPHAVTR